MSFRVVSFAQVDNETVARAVRVGVGGCATSRTSKRLLALRGDARLVEQLRGGDGRTFEVICLFELRRRAQTEVAEALGCEIASAKRLVFEARSRLIERRNARRARCPT